MKLAVTLLLFAAVSHAAKTSDFGTKQKIQGTDRVEKTEKRELVEGNSGIEKRTPLLPSVSSTVATGGVEYADSKENLQDKSPTQQIYATPVPQIAKISDVLTGQGPPFQAAIASHLYSPVSIYQPRLGSPTTYEVSAPVPSQLAYTEHRLSVPSNALQYSQKSPLSKPIIANYNQPQAYIQPAYEQNLVQLQPIYQQSPINGHPQNHYQPLQYSQPQVYNQQHLQYLQEQPAQQNGIIYAQPGQPSQYQKQPEQRELKSQPAAAQIIEKQQIIQQDYNDKQQNALSYARFTFNQAAPSHEPPQIQESVSPSPQPIAQQEHQQLLQPHPQQYAVHAQPIAQINYQLQHPTQQAPQLQLKAQEQIQQPKPQQIQQQQVQYQGHQEAQQLQYQGHQQIQQPLQYQQPQIQYQEPQYVFPQQLQQVQPLSDLHLQPQPQYQIQPQQYQLPQIQPQLFNVEKPDVLSKQSVPPRQLFYKQPFQQQLIQPQAIPQAQDLSYKNLPVLPTFPPVQYFGKFAHSIFSNYQH